MLNKKCLNYNLITADINISQLNHSKAGKSWFQVTHIFVWVEWIIIEISVKYRAHTHFFCSTQHFHKINGTWYKIYVGI